MEEADVNTGQVVYGDTGAGHAAWVMLGNAASSLTGIFTREAVRRPGVTTFEAPAAGKPYDDVMTAEEMMDTLRHVKPGDFAGMQGLDAGTRSLYYALAAEDEGQTFGDLYEKLEEQGQIFAVQDNLNTFRAAGIVEPGNALLDGEIEGRTSEQMRAELLRMDPKYVMDNPDIRPATQELFLARNSEATFFRYYMEHMADGTLLGVESNLNEFEQEGRLRPDIRPAPEVARKDGETVFFGYNSAELTDEGKEKLREIAERVKAEGSGIDQIIVTARTDAQGSAAYNQGLSEKRALAVGEYLEGQEIDSSLITLRALGKQGTPAAGDAAAQRRAEVTLGSSKFGAVAEAAEPAAPDDNKPETRTAALVQRAPQ